MGSELVRRFKVPAGESTLTLEDLAANVTVTAGMEGVDLAIVTLSGPEKLLENIKVEQPSHYELTIKGERSSSGSTIIQSFSSGGGFSISQSVGNISGGSVFIGGGKGRGRTIISSGDLVVVDGKVISGGDDDVTVIEGDPTPTILVTVPPGTNLEIYNVENCTASGLSGKLTVSLSDQDKAHIDGADVLSTQISPKLVAQCP